jgi:hypothetical protein
MKPTYHLKRNRRSTAFLACVTAFLAVCASVPAAPVDDSAASDQQAANAALVQKTLNPVADLISVPVQNNWDFGIGPADAMKFTANVQPVVPVSLSHELNLITRTIMPIIYAEAPFPGGADHSGLGDITQSFFISPKEPEDGWIEGAGPVFYYPTATDSALGAGKWGIGPTVVLLRQTHGWTYGALANHIWSFAGWGDQAVNASFLQPFVSFSTKTFTSFTVNTETTYDWEAGDATVPLNFMVSQLLKVGKQPISLQLGYRYYAQRPAYGPDWGLRFTVTLLFPKG